MQRRGRDVRQELRAGLVAPAEPGVRAAIGVARGEVAARTARWLLDARGYVEHRQVVGPVLVKVPALDQLSAQGRVDRDTRHRLEFERPQEVARCNEREVVLDLRRPYVRRVELTAL